MATLETRLGSLITALGTDWKNIWAKIGAGSLNTTATNLIAAINEVKVTADAAGGAGALDDLSDVIITTPATGHIIRHNGTNFVNVLGTTHFEVAGAAASAQAAAIAASQPLDSDLTSIAALTTTAYGRAFLALANQAATMALLSASTSTAQGIVELATDAETTTGTDTTRATTPANVKAAIDARTASETAQGIVELATTTEASTGSDTTRAVTAAGVAATFTARIATGTSLGTSDTLVPSQNAVKAYADALIGAANGVVFKGVIDCSTNPNYPASNAGDLYRVSVAGRIGGASGTIVEIGDLLLALTDGTASGTQAAVGANWNISQNNLDGAVIGPASAVSGQFASYSGTTGKLIQDSGISLDTDAALTANSATRVPSQSAVKSYAQPLDSDLTAIAALATTAYGRGLLILADQAALTAAIAASSETVSGRIEIATQAEITTGTDDVRAVTPLKHASDITTKFGNPDADLAGAYTTAKA
jgi:hypothetical protein